MYTLKSIHRAVYAVAVILILALQTMQSIALTAQPDRQLLPLNETLRLEIRSNKGGDLDDMDLSAIETHFTILSRSSQSSFSIINGRTESVKSLNLILAPRQIGSSLIPSLSHQGEKSRPVKIKVIKAAPVASKMQDQSVFVESEIDKHSLIVGEQLLYTLRIFYRVQLNNAEIGNFELDDVDITMLEDKSYQRTVGGIQYNVAEKRYALFFQQAGEITLPGQQLTALINTRSRGRLGFDPFSRGTELRLASKPQTVTVKEKPVARGKHWLPSPEVKITERWPSNNDTLKVGEPITRRIEIRAKGVTAEQLPEITISTIDGLNQYPEKPAFTNQEWLGGIAGKRTDTVAIIPTRPGRYTLPSISLPWWNTEKSQWETAILRERTINVVPGTTASGSSTTDATSNELAVDLTPLTSQESLERADSLQNHSDHKSKLMQWRIIAAICSIGWLLTVCWFTVFRPRNGQSTMDQGNEAIKPSLTTLKQSKKALLNACKANDAQLAKQQLQLWLTQLGQQSNAIRKGAGKIDERTNPEKVLAQLGSPSLNSAATALNAWLYDDQQQSDWNGKTLSDAVQAIKNGSNASSVDALDSLYPTP